MGWTDRKVSWDQKCFPPFWIKVESSEGDQVEYIRNGPSKASRWHIAIDYFSHEVLTWDGGLLGHYKARSLPDELVAEEISFGGSTKTLYKKAKKSS